MTVTDLPAVPVGDVQLYDNLVPAITGGNYAITVTHDAPDVLAQPATVVQRFTVQAPQFAIDPGEIAQRFPPEGSTGQFDDTLPFVVLSVPELPWERRTGTPGGPWLALLVLGDDEIVGGSGLTRTTTTNVEGFLALPGVAVPRITKEADIGGDSPCSYVEVTARAFAAVAPRGDETPYLAHVRVGNVADKALQGGTAGDGRYAVVVANRFPAPGHNIVHLVSLEGTDRWADTPPAFATVALVSLASWSFRSVADPAEDFTGLAVDLLENEYEPTTGTHHPDRLWLRLPTPAVDSPEVQRRIAEGFVPLAHHTRSGEASVAWYRGPLAPVLPAPVAKDGPFLSADAAMAYDPAHGVFDLSLAAAWQIGRLAALADRSFAQALHDLRRRLHLLTDQLADRLTRDHFTTPADLDQLTASGLLAQRVLGVLQAELLHDIGRGPAPVPVPPSSHPPDTDPRAALTNFLAEEAHQQAVIDLVADDLDPVAQWLARLLLLETVPFEHLVADPAMLPLGSVRFFYVDPNWTSALLDGATSIGLESSLQTLFHRLTAGIVAAAAAEAAAARRSTLLGTDAAPGSAGVVAGMLLRSPLVTGWPNLAVRPFAADGSTLAILRMERLGSGVLLCLFDGVPARVVISEPQEGVRFGTSDRGQIELRNLSVPGKPVGEGLGLLPIREPATTFLRADGRVLNLAPAAPAGLVQGVLHRLIALGQHVTLDPDPAPGTVTLGPAAFALQILKTPEELTFLSGGGS